MSAETFLHVSGGRTWNRSVSVAVLFSHSLGWYRIPLRLAAHGFSISSYHALYRPAYTNRLYSSDTRCASGYAASSNAKHQGGDPCSAMHFFVYVPGARSIFY
jgi:hypothetical protein